MSPRARNSILAGVAVALLGGFGALAWVLTQPVEIGPDPALANPAPGALPISVPEDDAGVRRSATQLAGEAASTAAELKTTVVFPLKIELELVRANDTLQVEGVAARGTDATARLRGTLHDAGNATVRGRVEFLAGPNEGRILQCDNQGRFGANDLYPGRSQVEVTGPGIPGSLREVVLRKGREELLNIGYGRPATIVGEVVDDAGQPVEGAVVHVDGQRSQTDVEGLFSYQRVASGNVVVTVEKPGFASVFQLLNVMVGANYEKGKIKYRLERGARLTIQVPDRINAGEEAFVLVLPTTLSAARTYPWARLNPVRIHPGGTKVLEDLPSTRVTLRLFHAGARARPKQREVNLDPADNETVVLNMEPAPVVTAVVMQDGKPVNGAQVTLEVPERLNATLEALGEHNYLLVESEVIPALPPAVQVGFTNGLGEVQLTANEELSRIRYLVARSKDGLSQGQLVLRGGEQNVVVELVPLAAGGGGRSVLRFECSERHQALPVETLVNAAPRGRVLVPHGRDVRVEGLVAGTWRVKVRWDTEVLVDSMVIELGEELSLPLNLPRGAIDGQDEDTRKRAGKP